MRLESCRHFDTEMFIKQLKIWGKEKERLKERLEDIPLLPSLNNESGVRSTDISEPTARLALKRLEITEQIEDIERCERVYEIAKSHLTPEERELFEMFFEPKEPIWRAIEKYEREKYTSRMNIYRERRRVLKKLDEVIATEFLEW